MGDDKELQKPVLPKDVFRSTLTFRFYEISALRLPWVVSALSLGLGCIAVRTLSLDWFSAFIFFEIEFIFFASYLDYMRWRLNITPLLQQVLELKPGTDVQRWDEVAHKLNLFFYQEHLWSTPYCFFAGGHAHAFFSQQVLRPYFEGKFDDISDADKIESASDYLQSLNEQFEILLKDDLPQLPLNAELPRDTQKSFFFFLQRLHIIHKISLCYLQGLAFYMLLGACFEVRFRKLASGLSFPVGFKDDIKAGVCFAFYLGLQLFAWIFCRESMRSIHPELGIIQAINVLAMITKVSPGKKLDNWDQIAMLVNRHLIEEDGGYSKNIFFDGKHCLNFYKTYFEPLSTDDKTKSFIDLKEIFKTVQSKIE